MSTYAIGDVHGCLENLQALLQAINFDAHNDSLIFTGDLVNVGPDSLGTLRFIKSLGDKAICILGNHDLTLLAMAAGGLSLTDDLATVVGAPDCKELTDWLKMQPLAYYHADAEILFVHAGVAPQWDLQQVLNLAREVEQVIQHDTAANEFYQYLYGNQPEVWQDNLMGPLRIRCIVNYLTRMRFCTVTGKLDFYRKGGLDSAPAGFKPWFQIEHRKTRDVKIIFGHWAALRGETGVDNVISVDTGCVWGNLLTALRLEDGKKFQVPGIVNYNMNGGIHVE